MEIFRTLVMDNLSEKSRVLIAADKTPPQMKYAAGRWLSFVNEYKENPKEKDRFFFGAPVVILIAGDSSFDAALRHQIWSLSLAQTISACFIAEQS